MTSLHTDLAVGEIHIPYQWTYADQTAREGASGFDALDIGKFARQLDDNSIWMLTATTPTWIAVGGSGGGGEANTASNIGTAGVGLFKQKSGVDLQFKKLNTSSSKISITDDTGNDEVDVGWVPWQQQVHVAKSGGQYTTIQGAIDSITDASAGKRYVVLVHPGDYAENITMKSWVDVVGVNAYTCRVVPTSGTAIAFGSTFSNIQELGVCPAYGTLTDHTDAVSITGGVHVIARCNFEISKTGGTYTLHGIDISNGVLVYTRNRLDMDVSGSDAASDIHAGFIVSGDPTISFSYSSIDCDNADNTDTIAAIEQTGGSDSTFAVTSSRVNAEHTGAGDAIGVYATGGANGISIVGCSWTISANSGDAYGGIVNSLGGGGKAETYYNNIRVTSTSGSAYAGNIAADDEWYGHFDVIEAADGIIGAGTVTITAASNEATHRLIVGVGLQDAAGTNTMSVAEGKTAYDHSQVTTGNPHSVAVADLDQGTLSDLNGRITDATLDDSGDSRPPTSHALGGSAHSADTLANLNSKVSDATLDDSSDPRTPTSHASSHQNGGSDEVATATPAANVIPKAGAAGTIAAGFVPDGADATAIHDNVASEINAITSKASPVGGDALVIEDSEASYAKKKLLLSNLPGGVDTTAIHKATSGEINAIGEKTTLSDNDVFLIEDSEATYAKKKAKISNIPGAGPPSSEIVEATGTITTTSTSDVLATSMTITPAAGTYLAWFSGSVWNGTSAQSVLASIYKNTTQEAASEREFATYRNDERGGFSCMARITVNGTDSISGRWRTSGGTASMAERTLMLLKVAAP